ncbi:MAG: acyltransferase family protein [Candidatus Thorarchaeota archaeon]
MAEVEESVQVESKSSRVFYIDNIRIYLTVLVILHHIAVGYGGSGAWLVTESSFYPIDGVTVLLFTLFNAINQSYFMAFFFLLAGYFTPRSFEKKGGSAFSKDRLVRLGVPLVVYAVLISPIAEFMARNYAYAQNWTFEEIILNRINNIVIGVDHLWFLLALLFFAGFYVLYRRLRPAISSDDSTSSFPNDKVIIASIFVVAIISFIVRVVSPIGFSFFFNFQFGHFTHYAFMFCIGILAYHGKWFDKLSSSQAKRWIIVAVLVVIALPIMLITMIDLNAPDFTPFLGGLTLESFIYSIWESFALLSISIGTLYVFKTKFNRSNKVLKNMGGSAYTAYIIHALIIIGLQILLLPVVLPAILKAVIVALIGIPLIFGLSALIRKIPGFSRVLG